MNITVNGTFLHVTNTLVVNADLPPHDRMRGRGVSYNLSRKIYKV